MDTIERDRQSPSQPIPAPIVTASPSPSATTPESDKSLADYRLPGGETGVEALTAVRARLGANLPVCVITGDLSPEIQARVEAMGGQFLHKPIRAEAMTALVEAAFRCGEADQGAGGDGFAANG
jgi:DNA-binding response OmpR family regulator